MECKALELEAGAAVEFVVDGDRVTVQAAQSEPLEDLIVGAVLARIEAEIAANPEQLVEIKADSELDAILATVRL